MAGVCVQRKRPAHLPSACGSKKCVARVQNPAAARGKAVVRGVRACIWRVRAGVAKGGSVCVQCAAVRQAVCVANGSQARRERVQSLQTGWEVSAGGEEEEAGRREGDSMQAEARRRVVGGMAAEEGVTRVAGNQTEPTKISRHEGIHGHTEPPCLPRMPLTPSRPNPNNVLGCGFSTACPSQSTPVLEAQVMLTQTNCPAWSVVHAYYIQPNHLS